MVTNEQQQPGEPRASPLVEQWTELTFAIELLSQIIEKKRKRNEKTLQPKRDKKSKR